MRRRTGLGKPGPNRDGDEATRTSLNGKTPRHPETRGSRTATCDAARWEQETGAERETGRRKHDHPGQKPPRTGSPTNDVRRQNFCPGGPPVPYLWYKGRRPPEHNVLSVSCPDGACQTAYKPDAEPEDSATCYQARSRPGSPENSLPGVREATERDLTLVAACMGHRGAASGCDDALVG